MAEIGDQPVGYVHHRPRDADEALSERKSRLRQAISIGEKVAMSRAELGQFAAQDAQAERPVSERAGDEHAIAGLRAPAQDRLASAHSAHGGDREHHRARCRHGIAAEQADAEFLLIAGEALGEPLEPCLVALARQRGGEQITHGHRAFAREIRQIHPQQLLRDQIGGIIG